MTPENLMSITDVEVAFGTTRLLPVFDEIPAEFRQGNSYTKLAYAIFGDQELPDMDLIFHPGFEHCAVGLDRCVRAHIASFEPSHQHKIAGVGYLISMACEMRAPVENFAQSAV